MCYFCYFDLFFTKITLFFHNFVNWVSFDKHFFQLTSILMILTFFKFCLQVCANCSNWRQFVFCKILSGFRENKIKIKKRPWRLSPYWPPTSYQILEKSLERFLRYAVTHVRTHGRTDVRTYGSDFIGPPVFNLGPKSQN